MSVIAEGVETDDQLDRLKTLGYDLVQGYHLGRPVPADDLAAPFRSDFTPALARTA
jgi:EAL domain-containing protein (putative c-di-GMP-specific phosphodiesterase class I)